MQGSARDFLKPKLVDSVEISKNEYRVVLEPFERGFGHTLGNSIRRTLLSSMVGSAITEVAIDGVMHEFSTIESVQEDVLDILLNLKEASIGLNASESATVIIEKEGPCELTVADIEANGTDVSVFNPEKVIATVNEGGKIRMTLGIGTGVGYDVAVARSVDSETIGSIQLDASFSPVPTMLNVLPNEAGKPATIPAKIIIEIPLPIPFSLICSPSHIKNSVPVVKVTTVTKLKVNPGFVTNATPPPI